MEKIVNKLINEAIFNIASVLNTLLHIIFNMLQYFTVIHFVTAAKLLL